MVQATANKNGFVNLESILQITEGQKCAITHNPDKIKSILKELHASHTIAANEDGTLVSKLGRNVEGSFDPSAEVQRLNVVHERFLKTVDKWLEDKIEEPEASTKEASKEDDDEPMMMLIAIPVMIV